MTFVETEHGHLPTKGDARCARGLNSEASYRLYVAAPQDNHTTETHAQHATSISLTKSDLFFETAISLVWNDAGTHDTNEALVDV